MTGWAFVKLGDLTTVVTKGTTPTSIGYEFKDAGINFVKVESISNNGTFIPDKFAKIDDECNAQLKRSQLEENDILFSIAGAIGRTAIVPKSILPANTNQALAIIRLKPDAPIYPDYLLRALASQSIIEQTDLMKGGVAQQNLSLAQLKAFEIPLPPLPVQKAIVAKLDAAFASIEQAIAAAERNAENAKQLFQSYLSEVFEHGGDGWEKTTLGNAYDVRDGTHDSPKFVKVGYPLVTSKNLKNGILSLDKIQYISAEDYQKINERSAVHKFDVLFAMIGTVGNPVVVEQTPDFAIKNVALFKNKNNNNTYFLRYYLMSDKVINKMSRDAKGATQKFVSLGYLRNFPFSLPNEKQQSDLVKSITNVENYAEKIQFAYSQKFLLLTHLKQSLLQQAFSGQLVDA